MSLPRPKKNTQLAWADLAIFASVIAFLAYSAHAFFFNSTRAPLRQDPAVETKAEPAAEPAPSRSPASQAPVTGKATTSTEVLRLNCLHSTVRSFASSARLMQIHAPFCLDDARQKGDWRAKNETSGEEILVFVNKKEKTFSTSYFSLKGGTNKIVFVQEVGKGQTREEKFDVRSDWKAD